MSREGSPVVLGRELSCLGKGAQLSWEGSPVVWGREPSCLGKGAQLSREGSPVVLGREPSCVGKGAQLCRGGGWVVRAVQHEPKRSVTRHSVGRRNVCEGFTQAQ